MPTSRGKHYRLIVVCLIEHIERLGEYLPLYTLARCVLDLEFSGKRVGLLIVFCKEQP